MTTAAQTPGLTVIDAETVRSAVSLATAREAVRDALVAVSKGTAIAPDELAMRLPHGGELHVKGAHLVGSRWIAFKVATGGFPNGGNSGGTMVLEAESGAPTFFLADGGWLTEIRTAAAAAIASRTLAIESPRRVAILGTGIQAGYQIEAHRDLLPAASFVVWGRTEAHRNAFGEQHGAQVATTLEEAVAGADVIVTTTSARKPILLASQISPGVQITAMGSDTADKNELDPAILQRADLIAADDVTVTSRVGELHHAPGEAARAINLGDLLSGTQPGRADASQITVCDLCGLGVEDAAMAELVLKGIG